jgi:hypothetical protein
LVPLKKNMHASLDAKGLARLKDVRWHKVDASTECMMVKKIASYGSCGVPLNIILVKSRLKGGRVRLWSLATTKDYADPCKAVKDYKLRWQIEERYKQIKHAWLNKGFSSPYFNLVVAHIIFSLLVYSLMQIYLNVKSLKDLANKNMQALMEDEALGKDSVIMVANGYYAVLDVDEGLYYVAFMEGEALIRFRKWITQFRKNKYKKNPD